MASFSWDSATRKATLPSASRNRRSRIIRPVTLSPSVPASGESLTRNVLDRGGGGVGWGGRRPGPSGGRRAGGRRRGSRTGAHAARPGCHDAGALQAGERQLLGDAALFDEVAVAVEHLDG